MTRRERKRAVEVRERSIAVAHARQSERAVIEGLGAVGRQRVVLSNQWLLGPLLLDRLVHAPATNALVRTTTAATMIAGGIKENVLPGEATAVINFRILPGDTIASVFPDAAIAPTLVLPGTDSKHYLALAENSYRFLPLRLRAEDLARIHGANERVAIADYRDIIRFYVELLRNAVL